MAKLKLGTGGNIPAEYRDYAKNQPLDITANGTYTASQGYDGIGQINVAVPIGTEQGSFTTNGTYTPTSPNVAFNQATVNVVYTPVTETKSITQNGIYTPSSGYDCIDTVTVNVPVGIKTKIGTNINNYLGELDADGKLLLPSVDININAVGVTDLANYALYFKYYAKSNVKTVSFPDLTTVSGSNGMNYAFQNCTSLTSVDLSSLTTVSGGNGLNQVFYGCSGLTSVDLSNLTTISGESGMKQAFYNCTGLTSVDLSNLTTISGGSGMSTTFRGCTSLTSVDLSNLTTISGGSGMQQAFYGCTSLKTLSFPKLKDFGSYINQFSSMLYNCSNITVHFRYDMEDKVKSLTGYSATKPFSASSGSVVFDLSKATLAFNVTTNNTPVSVYIDGELQS